jgi:hypothetical protein
MMSRLTHSPASTSSAITGSARAASGANTALHESPTLRRKAAPEDCDS